MDLRKYVVKSDETVYNALKKIDTNKKGFLVVIDNTKHVVGTLTDGDIRRAFIKGISINEKITNVYTERFQYLLYEDGIAKAIDVFKNGAIKFLPILDSKGSLLNIITKYQLHTLLLEDIRADLSFDFMALDENLIDYEIFPRPWGFYKTTVMNEYCQAKVICVYPKSQLSLQSHNRREEHWIVTHGKGVVQIGESELSAQSGSSFFIPKGCKHRLTNVDEKENLVVTEVQIGDYFGEDDIIRYEDIYGRVGR